MSHEDERSAGGTGGGGEDLHHLVAGGLVQGAGGLVGEDHAGLTGQGAGNGDALCLTTGHVAGTPTPHVAEPQLSESFVSSGERPSSGGAGEHQRQRDVLARRELGDELTVLKDEPELVQPQVGAVLVGQLRDITAADLDSAVIGDEDPREAVQER